MDMADFQELLPAAMNLKLQRPLVGHGCFGSVFEAVELHRNGKPSASRVVRFLPPIPGDEWLNRLRERVARLGNLRLPGVSTHRDGGIVDGWFYLVGDRHERTLDSLLTNDEERSPDEAWEIVAQLLDGLAALHERDIAHGDLRPRHIFIDATVRQGHKWAAWIGDPMLGALNWASDGFLVDDDARAYRKQPDQSVEPSPRADLYALGCIACELVCGRDANPNRNVDEGASQASVASVTQATGSAHELAILVDWLLGERLAEFDDAIDLRCKLNEESARRKRRPLKYWAWTTTVLSVVFLSVAIWALWAKVGADGRLREVQKTVADLQTDNAGLKTTVDEQGKKVAAQVKTIAALKQEIEELTKRVPTPPILSPEDIARREWSAAVKRREQRSANLNELDEFEDLCSRWAKMVGDQAPADLDPRQVSEHLNQWYKDIRRLLDDAKTWIIADPEMKRKFFDARANPWDLRKLDATRDCWNGLKSAARTWNEWVDDYALTWQLVHSSAEKFHDPKLNTPANLEAKRALQQWLLDMTRVGFVLELTQGSASDKVDYGTDRIATVYTGDSNAHAWPEGGFEHNWPTKTGSNYQGDAAVHIAFDWRPGEPVEVLLEGERAYSVGAHLNLVHKAFAGPLAPYGLHRAGRIISDDGNITLSFRVQNCPGPPRNWNSDLQNLLKPGPAGAPP